MMVIPGIDNKNAPVFSAKNYSRDDSLNNASNVRGSGRNDRNSAAARTSHGDNGPRHYHLPPFCPAANTGCGLFGCVIHGCRCWFLLDVSRAISIFVTICVFGITYSLGMSMLNPPDVAECSSDMSVSQILQNFELSEEIRSQLISLQYAYSGVCKWKESASCIGLPNIAAVELGSSIVSTFDTVPYGKSFCEHASCRGACGKSCPQILLMHDVVPGRNFNFVGTGRVLIKLPGPAIISGFTLHHPAHNTIPSGFIRHAPKDFEVKGYYWDDENKVKRFGKYKYLLNSTPAQAFPVKSYVNETVNMIEVTFLSNHGNDGYTAVYRFEVHGDIDQY